MSDRRRFSSSERAALYLAAEGRCSVCGVDLEPGWHADHMDPWSKGGATDVINGQALCPDCNLEKGHTSMPALRPWQKQALTQFLSQARDFLAVATPGAGKTTFAVHAAQRMIDRDEIRQVIVVVPSVHLRGQWDKAAHPFGLKLDPTFANAQTVPADDFDGLATTYASVASQPLLWRKLATRKPTLVVLDEIHHGGDHDDLTWGRAVVEAFGLATRRLLLSGTPARSDGHRVPFVTYDESGAAVADFNYDYGQALQDGGVVRPVAFPVRDGEAKWTYAGLVPESKLLSDASDDDLPKALRAVYAPDGEWIRSVLAEADADLTAVREQMPDAGAMINACDQAHARSYVDLLHRLTGVRPAIAVSDDPKASDTIDRFSAGRDRWLVTVNMVSEGVDIPRLAVGVYASRYRTEMTFRQWVGRFVRLRNEDEVTARLFIPAVDSLVGHARRIEYAVEAYLRQQDKNEDEGRDTTRQLTLSITDPAVYSSGESVDAGSVHRGSEFSPDELARAKTLGDQAGMRDTPEAIATLLRMAGHKPVVASVPIEVPNAPAPTFAQQKAGLRRKVNRLVNQYANVSGEQHRHIHSDLNKRCGDRTIQQATVDTLERRLEILRDWLL